MDSKILLESVLSRYLRHCEVREEAQFVLTALVSRRLEDLTRSDIWPQPTASVDDTTRASLAGFVVEVIGACLSDHTIDRDEMALIKRLKALVLIEDGDLLKHQHDRVAELLGAEMGLILRDKVVDRSEALHQADLQAALGLGYDQWLSLTEGSIRPIVDEFLREATTTGLDKLQILARLRDLQTVLKIDFSKQMASWPRGGTK